MQEKLIIKNASLCPENNSVPITLKKFIIFIVFSIFSTIGLIQFSTTANADGYAIPCQPVYGGGQSCPQASNIAINKQVANPKTNSLTQNLSIKDPHFAPNQTVTFQISIMNNGQSPISQVNVSDVFPKEVNFVQGTGNFDQNSKTLSFTINNLQPNESRVFTIQGQVVGASSLPKDKTVTCVVNQAFASSSDNSSAVSQSSSQLCIERTLPPAPQTTKGGLPVFPAPSTQSTPSTGPEALPFLLLIPTAAMGIFLRKKSLFS